MKVKSHSKKVLIKAMIAIIRMISTFKKKIGSLTILTSKLPTFM